MSIEKVRTKQLDRVINQLKELSSEELEYAEQFLEALFTTEERPGEHYFGKFLEIEEEGNLFKMKLGKQNENMHGVAQGGSLVTFADIAIGYSLMKELATDVKVFTLELKMNFIKGGGGEYLIAKPNIIHLGGTTAVTECDILDDKGDIVAKALGTFYLKR